jgi:hypothetical protein
MVLLHGARVLTAFDRKAAKEAFREGVAIAESLTLEARPHQYVLHEAVEIGASLDPLAAVALFRRLPPDEDPISRRVTGTRLVHLLAQSGDFETAIELLEDANCEVGGAHSVVQFARDPALQRRAMLAAYRRWQALRKHPDIERNASEYQDFYRLFSRNWRQLELPEAETWLQEILSAIETDVDQSARVDYWQRVTLHSTRDMYLFEILNVVAALKPPQQIEEILRAHPDVAEAAKLYPLGVESLIAQQRPASKSGGSGMGFGYAGSGRDGRSAASMMAAQSGDPSAVQDMLAEAGRLYAEDTAATSPNIAPRIFWPSCQAYKVAMYWAGNLLREEAEPLLAEIPDPDFALLASIEVAAGALGLVPHSGVRMRRRANRTHQ